MATYRITAPDGGTYEVTAPDTASEAEVLAYAQKNYKPAEPSAPTKPKTFLSSAKEAARDLVAGGVRGAGSIGATLLAPIDAAARAVGVQNDFIGRDDRREQMDAGLQTLGADTNSLAFKTGKLGAEIAGTAGAGSVLAKPVMALANTRYAAGLEPLLEGVGRGLQTGGFRVGELAGTGAGTVARMATGAATGGAMAGAVNPQDAGVGALIGGALPGATQLAGKAGEVAGSVLRSGPKPNQTLLDTARQSMDAGYVIPPNMLKPSFKNQVIESISGKQATQQIASTKNTQVTEGLVRQALGIADDVPLTQSTLERLRKTAGRAYSQVASLSDQAAADLEALKVARNEAQGWFKAYNRSASPLDLAKAKEARALSETLETALEAHAKAANKPELIPALRTARKEIAKTYTVGRALNDASGTVDARVLGRMYEKGSPLSDGLDTAGRFASAFPTVAKSPQQIGSPAAHNLKSIASMAFGGGGLAAMGPGGLTMAALPFVAPPIARSLMFSPAAQRGLLSAAPGMLDETARLGLLANAYRAAPVLSAQ